MVLLCISYVKLLHGGIMDNLTNISIKVLEFALEELKSGRAIATSVDSSPLNETQESGDFKRVKCVGQKIELEYIKV